MVCNSQNPIDERDRGRYKKVTFLNQFDFNTYGSVISLANGEKSYLGDGGLEQVGYGDPNAGKKEVTASFNSNDPRPKIYIQNPHKAIDSLIESAYPEKYDLRFFNKSS